MEQPSTTTACPISTTQRYCLPSSLTEIYLFSKSRLCNARANAFNVVQSSTNKKESSLLGRSTAQKPRPYAQLKVNRVGESCAPATRVTFWGGSSTTVRSAEAERSRPTPEADAEAEAEHGGSPGPTAVASGDCCCEISLAQARLISSQCPMTCTSFSAARKG